MQNAIQYEKYKYYDQRACKKEQRGAAAVFAGHINVEGEEKKKVTFSCYPFTLCLPLQRPLELLTMTSAFALLTTGLIIAVATLFFELAGQNSPPALERIAARQRRRRNTRKLYHQARVRVWKRLVKLQRQTIARTAKFNLSDVD